VRMKRETELLDRVDELLAEVRQLRSEHRQLRAAHAKAVKTIEKMAAANDRLVATIEEQHRTIAKLEAQLRAARGLASDAPTVPSAQVPVYRKAPARTKGRRKPGRKLGHEGSGRRRPETIDQTVTHTLKRCPHCDRKVRPVVGRDQRPRMRVRYVVDIVPNAPEATEHRIGQYWCASCDRRVEPAVLEALPGSQLGIRVIVQSAILHYRFGIPTSKVIEILRSEHGFTVTKGGLHQAWQRLAEFLSEDYEEMVEEIRKAGALHADETGWRVNGDTHWLWCFASKLATVYLIDKSRGGEVARAVLGDAFDGTLIRDFYAAYNACESRAVQYCLGHLLRAFEAVEKTAGGKPSQEFSEFRRKVTRIIQQAIKWERGATRAPPEREAARVRFERRLVKVLEEPHHDRDVVRLARRMWNSAEGLFTFLTEEDVDPTNNWAELNIRSAVVMRKNSYGNRSRAGADAQAILMSIFRTLDLRKEDMLHAAITMVERRITERHCAKHTPTASEG
jgi:hypothetical protein